MLIDADGSLALADFGISKVIQPRETSKSICGTLEYMAPEVFSKSGHSLPVDWWSLGILTYQMLFGQTPYFSTKKTKEQLKSDIKSQKFHFSDSKHQLSDQCKDFIEKLLKHSPNDRLGSKDGVKEVLQHPWLRDLDQGMYLRKEVEHPIKPRVSNNTDDLQNFKKIVYIDRIEESIMP